MMNSALHRFKRGLRAVALLLVSAFLLVSCASTAPNASSVGATHEPTEEESQSPAASGTVMDVTPEPVKEETEPPTASLEATTSESAVDSANDFAFRFSTALLKERSATDNFVCSPYSLWLPLVALSNATDEAVLPQLLETIGVPGASSDELNAQVKQMLDRAKATRQNEYNKEDGLAEHNPLEIANGIFVGTGESLNDNFAQVFATDYDGEVMEVDFSSDDAVNKVNSWASEKTNGLIPEVIDSFDPQTLCAIANAIYFSDRWSWEFNKAQTEGDTFHAPNGDITAQFMKHEGGLQPYYEDASLQAVSLPFLMGGGLLVLLPKDVDAVSLLSSLTHEQYSQVMKNLQETEGKLLLPRFEIEGQSMNLLDSMNALGVPLTKSDTLTGLLEDHSLSVSQAVQSAKIRVNEEGTTAAAVTVVAADGAGLAPETAPFEMNCNKPFVFVLFADAPDGQTQILFTGLVNSPEDPGDSLS